MKREEMIQTLIKSALVNKPNATAEEVAAYRKHLEAKTDMQLTNILMINCF
jgi:hypothetical protein